MHFDWKAIARTGAALAAGATGHSEIISAETVAESAVASSQAHAPVAQQVDAYSTLSVQVIETAEGFEGKELVDDVQVQQLVKGVHDAVAALAAGLAAKKLVASMPAVA
jgi:hypothetical protein